MSMRPATGNHPCTGASRLKRSLLHALLARFPFVRDLLGFDFAAQFLCQKPRTRPNLVGVLRLIAAAED
jgi:hypothetical protein